MGISLVIFALPCKVNVCKKNLQKILKVKWSSNKWGFEGCLASCPGNRPKSAFFCLYRPSPEGPNSTGKSQKTEEKALLLRIYPRICLNPHLFNPHFRVAQEPNWNRKPEPSEPLSQEPNAEPEPPEPFSRNRNRNRNRPFLEKCTETHKIPLFRGTAGTENRNRSNRPKNLFGLFLTFYLARQK